jgi:hypothetical protein
MLAPYSSLSLLAVCSSLLVKGNVSGPESNEEVIRGYDKKPSSHLSSNILFKIKQRQQRFSAPTVNNCVELRI